jgi:hypothetical protein
MNRFRSLLTNEWVIAFLIAWLVILFVIFTAGDSPTWIYQGF